MEIEKGFSLYKWPFLANRNWPKKRSRKPRRRISITARLPFKRHRRSLRVHIYLYRTEIYGKTHTTEILTSLTFIL